MNKTVWGVITGVLESLCRKSVIRDADTTFWRSPAPSLIKGRLGVGGLINFLEWVRRMPASSMIRRQAGG